jgi:hypothetical protein
MPDISGGVARYDIHDPKDLALLISSGAIWKGGPKAVGAAVKAIMDGVVPRPDNVPPNIASFLDQFSPAVPQEQGVPQAAEQEGPAEQGAPTEEPEPGA